MKREKEKSFHCLDRNMKASEGIFGKEKPALKWRGEGTCAASPTGKARRRKKGGRQRLRRKRNGGQDDKGGKKRPEGGPLREKKTGSTSGLGALKEVG